MNENWHDLIAKYQEDMMMQYASSQTGTVNPNASQKNESDDEDKLLSDPSEDTPEYIDIGQLQVRVTTENQAVPIPNAVVTVTSQHNDQTTLIRSVITDRNGLTTIMDLPTKDRRFTLIPGYPTPYAAYNLDITAPGYFSKRFTDLPIYGGVTGIQNVSMIPLPENGDPNTVLLYPESAPSL